MGLLNKIKGILFEEVEEDEVVNTPKAEEKKPIAEKIEPQKKVEEVETPKVNVVKPKAEVEQLNERELFKSDNTSPFFDFDEEEFSNMSRVQKPKPSTNVLEYERKKKMEKRYDMGSFTKVERTEVVDVTEEQIENIKSEISSYKNIEEVTFKSKDEWKLEMSEYDDSFKTVLNYLDENPLMDSFVLKVNDVKKLSETSEYIKAINGVDTVKYGEGMVEQVISVFDIVQKIVVVVVIALIVVTSFLISNTIKLTIFSRRNEIEIMRLVGASNITIKLPFLFEGFIIGLIGSIIPVCITIYGYVILYSRLHGKLFSNMIMLIKPYPFVFGVSLIVIAIGALVGMYGSIKAVRKYLKV